MQHIITKRNYFTSLDGRFNPCSQQQAMYQLEMYNTDKGNIFAIASYTGKFSYAIGQNVTTLPCVKLNNGLSLDNVIKNAYLNSLSNNRML